MAIDIKNLFRIAGEEGPALRSVEEALEWLLSPKAEGIGQKLLQDAHALHGKPLTIVASTEAGSGYLNAIGEHTIRINPDHVGKVSILAADGTSHAMSVERCLGHELKHAGQARVSEGAAEKMLLEAQIGASHQNLLTAEQRTAQFEPMINALEAPDYHTARQHLARYVDETALPMQEAVDRELFTHPDYVKHLEEFEMPAIEVENRIAALRSEPIRTDYTSAHKITPEKKREMMIDELSAVMELNKKSHLDTEVSQRVDGKSWVSALGDRSGRKLD